MNQTFKLVVFLGNPGKKYEKTRHNLPWRLADRWDLSWQKKFNGLWTKDNKGNLSPIYLKPQTLMNRSGDSVRKAMDFFKLTPKEILIVHDELELPYEEVKYRFSGGMAGHNGLKSVKQQLGTADFGRLRMGIGRPPFGDVSRWVLSPFAPMEEALMDDVLDKAEKILKEMTLI